MPSGIFLDPLPPTIPHESDPKYNPAMVGVFVLLRSFSAFAVIFRLLLSCLMPGLGVITLGPGVFSLVIERRIVDSCYVRIPLLNDSLYTRAMPTHGLNAGFVSLDTQ